MNIVFIFIYLIAITVIITGGIIVYKKTRHLGRVSAILYGLLISASLAISWPIPTHGGFIFLGEIVYGELERWQRESKRVVEVKKKDEFLQQFDTSTASKLTIRDKHALKNGWWKIRTDSGSAYFDENAQLYWSMKQLFYSASPLSDLAAAKELCQQLAPQGTWSLPTEVEQYFFWRNTGAKALPDGGPSAMSILTNENFQTEMPVVNLGRQSGSNQGNRTDNITLPIRCVARSEQTPPHGYLKKNIPFDEWNRYQLSKLN